MPSYQCGTSNPSRLVFSGEQDLAVSQVVRCDSADGCKLCQREVSHLGPDHGNGQQFP